MFSHSPRTKVTLELVAVNASTIDELNEINQRLAEFSTLTSHTRGHLCRFLLIMAEISKRLSDTLGIH